jgi:hypothetical protein
MIKPSEAVKKKVPAAAALNGKAMTAARAAMMAGAGNEFITVVELIAAAMMPRIAKTRYGPDGTGPIDP